MNIIEIENKRLELLSNLNNRTSNRQKLYLIVEFFDSLLQSSEQGIIYSYLLELSDEFVKNLDEWNVFYLPLEESDRILKLAKTLKNHSAFKSLKEKLVLIISKQENNYQKLDNILKGFDISNSVDDNKIYFPVLEDDGTVSNGGMYSYLESITVKISRGSTKDRFIIIPSMKVIEEKFNDQIKISWEKAIEILKKHRHKINQFHDVIINFDQKLGEYVGNSLGIALTLAFLQELFTFYNTPIKLKIPANLAFTGGINENAEIVPVDREAYIQSKIQCIFYSPVTSIILHRKDEEPAKNELEKLREKYPERKLKVIGVGEFNDLLNRRDIVGIKKQNPVIRTGKFIRQQKIAVLVIVISLLGFLYANIDFDNNPAYLTNVENIVYVHNKNGRILWKKKILEDVVQLQHKMIPIYLFEKVINISNDDNNDVLLSNYTVSSTNNNYDSFVACFDHSGKLIWKYKFDDHVFTKRDDHTNDYTNQIVDTLSKNGRQQIFMIARNSTLYPSALYKLDAKTGKRLPGTFWHAGHIADALIGDFGDNRRREVVGVAISNSFERCVLFSLLADSINGQGPAKPDYTFINIPIADLKSYILLPKSDLNDYYNLRYNSIDYGGLNYYPKTKLFNFYLIEGDKEKVAITCIVNAGLTDFRISVGDKFQVIRDSLVSKGLLKKPYSNTSEYFNLLKKQIKYWDGKEFRRMY